MTPEKPTGELTRASTQGSASELGSEIRDDGASIWNRRLRLDVVGGDAPKLVVSARRGSEWVAVLERQESTRLVDGALRVSLPEDARVSVTRLSHSICIALRGTVPEGSLGLVAWLGTGDTCLSLTETLNLNPKTAPLVAEFAASWKLQSSKVAREVFTPELLPEADEIVGMHCMRTPLISAETEDMGAALVVDVGMLKKTQKLPAFSALLRDSSGTVLRTGLVGQKVRGHVFFRATYEPTKVEALHHSYRLLACIDPAPGATLELGRKHVWEAFGAAELRKASKLRASADELAAEIYPRAFDEKWRETESSGKKIGAITTDRAFHGDVWMCAWFHNLSSAYGLLAFGKKLGRSDWVEKANAVRELHLQAPLEGGLFPTVYRFDDGGGEGRWYGSHPQGGGPDVLHLSDMSYTLYWLLLWEREFGKDPRTLERAQAYLAGLAELATSEGSLPAYVDWKTKKPVTRIDVDVYRREQAARGQGDRYITMMLDKWGSERFLESAEDAASLMFLAELLKIEGLDAKTRGLALSLGERLAAWLTRRVIEPAWYVDFEVYWSCAPNALDFYDARSGQHPQKILLAVYMCAQGLLDLYVTTKNEAHLAAAKRAMDRLCLHQQIFDPPFLNFDGFGGYAAQNTDGEWSDARQALFVITHLGFFHVTGEEEQLERARAACRASFTTVFHPSLNVEYPTGWLREPQGFAAENHAHAGHDHLCGVSSFHWGSGSALMAAAYLDRHGVAPW